MSITYDWMYVCQRRQWETETERDELSYYHTGFEDFTYEKSKVQ